MLWCEDSQGGRLRKWSVVGHEEKAHVPKALQKAMRWTMVGNWPRGSSDREAGEKEFCSRRFSEGGGGRFAVVSGSAEVGREVRRDVSPMAPIGLELIGPGASRDRCRVSAAEAEPASGDELVDMLVRILENDS